MSGVSPTGVIPSLGMNLVSEMCLKMAGFVDYKIMKNSDVDLAFITTNTLGNKSHP
jgi:hypothetical protein